MPSLLSSVVVGSLALLALTALARGESCNEHKKTETWFRLLQAGRFVEVERMYHRNALRYDNGALSSSTAGQPFSARQLACVDDRVEQRYEATGFAADPVHHTTVVVANRHVGVHDAWQFAVHFVWDTKTCMISEEHWTYATAHDAFMYVEDRVNDDCFGADLAAGAATTALQRYKDCWNFFVRKESAEIVSCFAADGEFLFNGNPMPEGVHDAAFWRSHLAAVDYSELEFHLTHDDELNEVSGVVTGLLTASDDDDDNDEDETWTFSVGSRAILNANGRFGVIEHIGSTNQLLRSPSYAQWLPAIDGPALWRDDAAKTAYKDAENFFGAATKLHDTLTGDGFADFANPDNVGCFAAFYVSDLGYSHFPADADAAAASEYHSFGAVQVQVPADKLFDVQKLGSSTSYDVAASLLVVGGDSVGSVVAQMSLALDVVANKKSLKNANEDLGDSIDEVHRTNNAGDRTTNDDGTPRYTDKFDTFASRICSRVNQLND